ncbi:MAG: hypothetical protein JXR59_10520 [Desulfuromonadaceae bacterium]|nr:hypothetical protein [Desulfuromonadaceae bacterium]
MIYSQVQQLKLALTGSTEELKALLINSAEEVLRAALKNINLNEDHLLTLLQRHDLPGALFKPLCAHPLSRRQRVALRLIDHPALPPLHLKNLLDNLLLFDLLKVCQQPGQATDIRIAAEQAIIRRLPTAPLGSKVSIARRASATVLTALIIDGHPQIIEACLDNPRLKEAALFKFLSGSTATAETISQIARHHRWNQRRNIRRAILSHRLTPQVWFLQFLPSMPPHEARQLLHSQRLTGQQKSWIRDHFSRH